MKVVLLLILLLVGNSEIQAQLQKGKALSLTYHYGRVIKHTPKLFFDVQQNSFGLDLNYKIKTFGKQPWHQFHNYPEFGLQGMFYAIDNGNTLGHAFGFLPTIQFYFFKREKIDAYFQLGSGVMYLTRHYDRIENPENNAIGSHWNNVTAMKIGFTVKTQKAWDIGGGISFTHFSNGASQLPNFGINIPAAFLSLTYVPYRLKKEDFIQHQLDRRSGHYFGLNAQGGLAFVETTSIGGPLYPIYMASIGLTYSRNNYNKWILGTEYEYHRSVYLFGWHTLQYNSEKEARQGASRNTLFAAHEFLFGNYSIVLQLGTYLGNRSFLIPNQVYSKLAFRYYLPAYGKTKIKNYLSVHLKAHGIRAEHIGMNIGVAF